MNTLLGTLQAIILGMVIGVVSEYVGFTDFIFQQMDKDIQTSTTYPRINMGIDYAKE